MKTELALSLSLFFLFFCTSCSRGFDRELIRSTNAPTTQMKISEQEQGLKDVLELKPQLPQKARLAVYFDNGTYSRREFWRLDPKLKDHFLSELRSSVNVGPFYDLVSITNYESSGQSNIINGRENQSLSRGGPMYEIRKAAARFNADAVLVVSPYLDYDKYSNPLLIFDIFTLSLTGFFLPAHNCDYFAMINASIWDVRNGYLYANVEAEAEDSIVTPLYWSGELIRKAQARVTRKAVDELLVEIGKRASSIHWN